MSHRMTRKQKLARRDMVVGLIIGVPSAAFILAVLVTRFFLEIACPGGFCA